MRAAAQLRRAVLMRAKVGDMLVIEGNEARGGAVIRVVGENGAPPYVIKWLTDGHISMVTPGPYSRIVPASDTPGDGQQPPDDL